MTQNSRPQLTPTLSKHTLLRLPKIQNGLRQGLTIKQIAEQCNVYEKTIDRDLKSWLQSGDFDIWLREEFLRLHNVVLQEDKIEAYRQITALLRSTLTHKIQAEQNVTVTQSGLEFEFDGDIKALLLKNREEQKATHDGQK